MIHFAITGTFTPEFLERVTRWKDADPLRLAEACKKILEDGNRKGLLAGIAADGTPMAELKESTIRRGRGGFGPPTVPRFSGSQLIDRFQVKADRVGVRGYKLRAGWPGLRQVMALNDGDSRPGVGGVRMKPRPLIGVRPADQLAMRAAARKYAEDLLKGEG